MTKVCPYCPRYLPIEMRRFSLAQYGPHLKTHGIEIMQDSIERHMLIKDMVEDAYDHDPASLGADGKLVDYVIRHHPWLLYDPDKEEMAATHIYDSIRKRIEVMSDPDFFYTYMLPLYSSILRAGRQLREEADDHPELHPNWKISEHVRVRRSLKEIAMRYYHRSQKAVGRV